MPPRFPLHFLLLGRIMLARVSVQERRRGWQGHGGSVFSHLPKVTGQVRWIHTIPGWACLGTRSRVGEGSQLSLRQSNDKNHCPASGKDSSGSSSPVPSLQRWGLRARNGRRVFPRVMQTAAELGLTPDLLLPGSATFPIPCVPILQMQKLRP